MILGFVGCTAIAVARPLTGTETALVCPLGIGSGPSSCHVMGLGGDKGERVFADLRAAAVAAIPYLCSSCCSSLRIAFMRMRGSRGLVGSMPRMREIYSS